MLRRKTLRKEFIWRSILSGGRFISPAPPWEVVTVSGDIVSISDAVSGENLVGCSVTVPYTSGGVQSVSVTRCGKNLFPDTSIQRTILGVSFQYSTNIKALIVDGIPTVSSDKVLFERVLGRGKSKIFTLSNSMISGSSDGAFISYFGAGDTITQRNNWLDVGLNSTRSAILPYNYINKFWFYNMTTGTVYNNVALRIQLEIGNSATGYEPYNGDTYTVAMPDGFYGGTVDLAKGTVTSLYDSTGELLPEPVVSSITPVEISTLTGVNNIWADAGNVEVKYYREGANT